MAIRELSRTDGIRICPQDFEFVLVARCAVIRLHNSLNSHDTYVDILINVILHYAIYYTLDLT